MKKSCETCLVFELNDGHREVVPPGYDCICLKCIDYSKWIKKALVYADESRS